MSAGLPTDHSIRTLFTTSVGARLLAGKRTSGMQITWSDKGPIDDSGERFISFMVRGPDMTEDTILGREEEIWLECRSPGLDLSLGDRTWRLSPQTEQGRWGRGAGLRIRRRRWSFNA